MNNCERLDIILRTSSDGDKFSGSVLIAVEDSIVLHKAYGYADLMTKRPNNLNTTYRIASITKMITSIAILMLYERRKLRLCDTLNTFFPVGLRLSDISIHHLLSMTSGISNVMPSDLVQTSSISELIEILIDKPLKFNPGAKFDYNNANYVLLTAIIEQVSGQTYTEFIKNNLFDVIGMNYSRIDSGSFKDNDAVGHTFTSGKFVPSEYYDVALTFGAGNIRSAPHDLYLFNRAFQNNHLLSEESKRLMQKPISQTHWDWPLQKQSTYGYGLVHTYNREYTVGHCGGGVGGFSSYFLHYVHSNKTIIILSNFEAVRSFADCFLAEIESILFM